MFPKVSCSTNSLQFFDADMKPFTRGSLIPGLTFMADHCQTVDAQCPQSPNSQCMYETDINSLIANCSAGVMKQSPSTSRLTPGSVYPYLENDAISPSVEGLTYDSNDILSFTYSGPTVNLLSLGDDEICKSDDTLLKTIDNEPTLTQLNTDDLESNFFDEFDGLSEFGTDSVLDCMKLGNRDQELMKFTPCTVTAPLSSMQATPLNWPQQILPIRSTIMSSGVVNNHPAGDVTAVNSQYAFTSSAAISATHLFQPAAAVATTVAATKRPLSPQPLHKPSVLLAALGSAKNVDWNWEEIESFLQSEGQSVATDVLNNSSAEPAAKKVKTEPVFIEPAVDTEETTTTQDTYVKTEDDGPDDDDDDDESGLSDNDLVYDDDDNDGNADQLSFLVDSTSRKEKTYFWQYNMQSKGPKGKRLCKAVHDDDPYTLHDFEDPVFDMDLQASASSHYRHSGKARRGDGNDVTPNPGKLFATGKELRKLTQLINKMTPTADMTAGVRARTLREKNKYASRVCRLKKKAQHEANKIKLHGLDQEHRQLINVLTTIQREIVHRVNNPLYSDGEKLTAKLETLIKTHLTVMTAGHTTEYVNSILAKVAAGDRSGGLVFDNC